MAGTTVPLSAGEVERMDTAYEVALDDDTDTDPGAGKVLVPVDTPGLPVAGGGRVSGCRSSRFTCSRRTCRATVRRALARSGHVAAFHAVRSPWYGAKLAWFAGRGFTRAGAEPAALVVGAELVCP